MSLIEPRLYRETLAAAETFHARKLWLDYENGDCFAVVVPGEEHPMFATIIGQGGEQFGLVLLRGPKACGNLMGMLDRDMRDTDISDETAFMGFSMGRYNETPPFGRSFLAKARFAGRGSSFVPCFMAKDAGKQPRALTRNEVEKSLYVLKGVLKAADLGILKPMGLHPGKTTLTLVISGDPMNPDVSSESRLYGSAPVAADAALPEVPGSLANLPRLPGRWLIGLPMLPATIRGDDRTIRLVLIVDEESELVVLGEVVQGGVPAAAELVYGAFRGWNALKSPGVPQEILVANRELFNTLGPALDSLGIRCRYEPAAPLLDELLDSFLETLAGPELEPEESGIDTNAVPPADDLEGWKACDRQLCRQAQTRLLEMAGSADRAMARYFGSAATGAPFLDDPEDIFPGMSFFEWYWLDYRATKRSKTLAEKMLAEELPRSERILLEARVQATPSMHMVKRIKKGESLTLLDVLFDGMVVVHDKGLSETARVDMSLAARVFPAGNFRFVSPLGPPLGALEVDEAIEFLERRGLKLTRDGVREKPHLFGRLWAWVEKDRARGFPRRITNTDGDDLCFHTATYVVKDEARARAAIAAREDIECDPDDRDYVWFRDNEPGTTHLPGDTVTLASLSLADGELLVEVNSAQRLKKIRAWLDGIPGLQFQSVRVRTLDEVREAGIPADDQIGREEKVPMCPELVAHLQEMMRDHYMQWLDTPIPLFDGKTPRDMCRTAEGMKRVARMIRTMPKPLGPAEADIDIDVPRDEMLKSLGLGQQQAGLQE